MLLRRLSATHVPRWRMNRKVATHQPKYSARKPHRRVASQPFLPDWLFADKKAREWKSAFPLAYPQSTSTHVTINTILPAGVLDTTNPQTTTVYKYNLQKQHTSCLRYPHPFVAIKDTTTTVVAGAVSHSFSERVSSHLHISRPPTIMCIVTHSYSFTC
jgi:hypothetical protein